MLLRVLTLFFLGAGNNTEQDDREIDMKLEEVHEAAVKVDHFVVGDKLPVVSTENKEKLGKLEKVIHKVFSMAGTVVRLKIPSANGKTKGFAVAFVFWSYDSSVLPLLSTLMPLEHVRLPKTSMVGTNMIKTSV